MRPVGFNKSFTFDVCTNINMSREVTNIWKPHAYVYDLIFSYVATGVLQGTLTLVQRVCKIVATEDD